MYHFVFLVLGRNVGRDEDSVEREQFLQEKLHVPRPWIAEAKAVYASTVGNYGDQAWYLIQVMIIYDNKPLCKSVFKKLGFNICSLPYDLLFFLSFLG